MRSYAALKQTPTVFVSVRYRGHRENGKNSLVSETGDIAPTVALVVTPGTCLGRGGPIAL